MKKLIEKHGINICLLIIFLTVVIMAFLDSRRVDYVPANVKGQLKEYEAKERTYTQRIDSLKVEIKELENRLNTAPEIITKIQTKYETKINHIDRVSDTVIYSLWAARYGQ